MTFVSSSSKKNNSKKKNEFDSGTEVLKMIVDFLNDVFDDVEYVENNNNNDKNVNNKEKSSYILVEEVVFIREGFDSNNNISNNNGNNSNDNNDTNFSHLTIEWQASTLNDTVADSVAGIVLQFFSTTNLLRYSILCGDVNFEKNKKKQKVVF
jgi:hypothetical protein